MVQAWSQLGDKLRMPYRSGYEEDGFLRLLNISHRSKLFICFNYCNNYFFFFSLKLQDDTKNKVWAARENLK
jgi:hypothetical protein